MFDRLVTLSNSADPFSEHDVCVGAYGRNVWPLVNAGRTVVNGVVVYTAEPRQELPWEPVGNGIVSFDKRKFIVQHQRHLISVYNSPKHSETLFGYWLLCKHCCETIV